MIEDYLFTLSTLSSQTLFYLNLCAMIKYDYYKGGIECVSKALFDKKVFESVDAVVANLPANSKTYIDEWIFQYNVFNDEEDSDFDKNKKLLKNGLKDLPIESDEFRNNIYYDIKPLVVMAIRNELEHNGFIEMLSLEKYELTAILNPKIISERVKSINAHIKFNLSTDELKDKEFVCKTDFGYIYVDHQGEKFVTWDIDLCTDDCRFFINDKVYNTTIFNMLCWLVCGDLSKYFNFILGKEQLNGKSS